MNDADRRFLTEGGGECWHELDPWAVGGELCKKCGEWDYEHRTFDTWEDFGWLINKVFEKGEVVVIQGLDRLINYLRFRFPTTLASWYRWEKSSPATRCQLICNFLREQEKGGEGFM